GGDTPIAPDRSERRPAPAATVAPPTPAEPPPPAIHTATASELARYPWLRDGLEVRPLSSAFAPPEGFRRVEAAPTSFGGWLRDLPLRPAGAAVHTFRG